MPFLCLNGLFWLGNASFMTACHSPLFASGSGKRTLISSTLRPKRCSPVQRRP
ncbi:hypothetical protein [Pseudomonas phage vB_Pae_CF67a]|nr:hypothetical protein [Pseudomonas phage vB_Pae_CF67a]